MLSHSPRGFSRLRLRRCRQLCQRCQTRRSVLGSLGMLRQGMDEFGFVQQQTARLLVQYEARPWQPLPVIHCQAASMTSNGTESKGQWTLMGRSSTMRIAGMALQAEAGGQALSEEEQADSLLLQRCMSRHFGPAFRPISFGSSATSPRALTRSLSWCAMSFFATRLTARR